MDVLSTILSNSRTVFTPQWLALKDDTRDRQSKNFAREQLIPETASALELFALCPLVAE